MKGFCPLASRSKGNCLFLGGEKTKLLIDAGLSMRAIQRKLAEIGVDLDEIDAIIITHEHIDHIRGLDVLTGKKNIPIFANSDTAKAIGEVMTREARFKIFSTGETFEFGEFTFHPFSIQHDTLDPVAFTIEFGGKKLGVCTDLGFATTLVRAHLKKCDYLFLEANHEPHMVHACNRPLRYKQRVLGRQGHLSNDASLALLKELMHPELKHVYFAHLSEECNSPDLLMEKAAKVMQDHPATRSIAWQDKVSVALKWD